MNVFIAFKGTHFFISNCLHCSWCFRGVWCTFSFSLYFDRKASDLDLHCLHRYQKSNAMLIWVNEIIC